MKYTMHCPVEACETVMQADAENDDEGLEKLIAVGHGHFAEAGYPMDKSMTPEMKDKMTREYMKKQD